MRCGNSRVRAARLLKLRVMAGSRFSSRRTVRISDYTKAGPNARIWRSNLDGTDEHAVTEAGVLRDFVITGDRLYYLLPAAGGITTLGSLQPMRGHGAVVLTFPKPMQLGLSVSPDGRYV